MSIEVTGPDGAIHEFPNETSPEVIKGVMAAQHKARDSADAAEEEMARYLMPHATLFWDGFNF